MYSQIKIEELQKQLYVILKPKTCEGRPMKWNIDHKIIKALKEIQME
jgi:hypothetical protein